jgi:hypothetical protein
MFDPLKDLTLDELCEEYLKHQHVVAIGRAQVHNEIAERLGLEHWNDELNRILYNLDKEILFPIYRERGKVVNYREYGKVLSALLRKKLKDGTLK